MPTVSWSRQAPVTKARYQDSITYGGPGPSNQTAA